MVVLEQTISMSPIWLMEEQELKQDILMQHCMIWLRPWQLPKRRTPETLTIYVMGSFEQTQSALVSGLAFQMELADLNGSGGPDLAIAKANGNGVTLWLNSQE